ncbi:MAG TPA: hypothetical protein DIC34_05740 [Treponema sp.]|nr:hypothetical protein [Treponema sp.]
MIKQIQKIGRLNSTFVTTLIVSVISQVITYLIYKFTDAEIPLSGRIASLASPILITPFLSWWFIGLLLKISVLEQEMRLLATYDHLTGAYNRNSFFSISASILNLLKREKLPLTALYIDIDHFKKVNDTFGHDVGDFVLKNIGKYVIENIRKSDIVGRIGGEEFVVALPKTDIDDGITIAEKLRKGISEFEMIHDGCATIKISVSIGISCNSNNENIDIDELLKKADSALYHAKNSGRNRIYVNQDSAQMNNRIKALA